MGKIVFNYTAFLEACKAKRVTEQFARDAVGIDPGALRNIRYGSQNNLKVEAHYALAKYLGVTMESLLKEY
jgi:hypothetical protein